MSSSIPSLSFEESEFPMVKRKKVIKKLVNLTPHSIKVLKLGKHIHTITHDGVTRHGVGSDYNPEDFIEYPSEGEVRIVTTKNQKLDLDESSILGVEVVGRPIYSGIEGLPEDGSTPIIVSNIVAQYIFDLTFGNWSGGIYVPDSSPGSVIRDSKGITVGVKRLIRYTLEE